MAIATYDAALLIVDPYDVFISEGSKLHEATKQAA